MLGLIFLEDVVLDRAAKLVGAHSLPLGRRHIKAEQDDGRPVDRHGNRDLVQRDTLEQSLHVGRRRDRHTAHTHLTERSLMIAVVPHERWEVECDREARLAVGEQILVALVRLFRGGEAGELPHGPQAGPVHRGIRTTCERKAPGDAQRS